MFYRISYIAKLFFLNPEIFFRKALGRILLEVVPSPKGTVRTRIGGYTIEASPSRNRWWKSMWLGYCDVEISHIIKRYLRPSGVFIDVGGGAGYFSAIASEIVGVSGQVHCFEPFPTSAKAIQRMVEGNPKLHNIVLNDYALGAEDGIHNYYIHRSSNSTAASMTDNLVGEVHEVIQVRTQRLDTYLEEKNISEVSLIKIDVDGYERFVLEGLAGFFERTRGKPPIICEILVPVYKESGFSLDEFQKYMRDCGYQAYNIFNPRIRVDMRLLHETTDVIFRPLE